VNVPPVEVEHLTRSYGSHRGIVDLSFRLRDGEVFAFLGPNGAGKTTTIRTLMGLLRATSGRARVFGLDCWHDAAAVKALVGFLPGEMRLYEGLTGHAFLDFFAAFRRRRARRRRDELAARLELDLSRRIRHMSKGNRQKLGIVQALMHEAPLLILDEPSSGLDPLKQVAFLDLLREEGARGRTIFLSSHAIPEVQRIADRVGIVREGRLIAVEEIAALIAKSARHANVTFASAVDPGLFAGLEPVTVLSASDDHRHYQLSVPGDLKPLLRRLVELPLADLTVETADLETVFLHYYSGPAAS
jgi:beta-exotoxin I transport system ATP-binding protein